MNKSVDTLKYNSQYFKERNEYSAYDQLKSPEEFAHIYQKAGSMVKLDEDDKVVDLGCGSGQLAFYLYLKYGADVTGIDYSKDAIDLSEIGLQKLAIRNEYSDIKNKVRFIWADNKNLPELLDVKAVFLVDVVEHLYNSELDVVFEKIKGWNKGGELKLIIHTDNNNYLRFVRPVTDFFAVLFKKTTFEKIEENKAHDQERHVNLTTAGQLQAKLLAHSFHVLEVRYPKMDLMVLRAHLAGLGKLNIVFYPIYFLGKIFYFLRPSFYLLAERKSHF